MTRRLGARADGYGAGVTARRLLRPALVAAGIAATLRAFRWRRHRRGPAEVRESREVELEPNPTGAGITLAVNPNAGSGDADLAAELREALPEAEVVDLDDPGDLEKVLESAAGRPGIRALGAAGGDGTMSWAGSIAAEHGLPLVVVSGGTLNHLAVDLGLDDVADTVAAVAAGQAVEVDLPTIDGRPFVNTASFGSYAELVDAREAAGGPDREVAGPRRRGRAGAPPRPAHRGGPRRRPAPALDGLHRQLPLQARRVRAVAPTPASTTASSTSGSSMPATRSAAPGWCSAW